MPLFLGKNSLITGEQAQQSFRFILNVKGVDAALISKVSPPSYRTSKQSYQMLEYKFHYPATPDWDNEISFDILQVIDEQLVVSSLGYFISKLYNSGYYSSPLGIGEGERDPLIPNSLYNIRETISNIVNNQSFSTGYVRASNEGSVLDYSKQKLTAALGRVEIKMLDPEGKTFESWRLNGAFITSIKPSELSYESETISKINVGISYDWADYGFRGVYAEEDVVSRIGGIF